MTDFNLEDKMDSEMDRLSRYKKISTESLENFSSQFPSQLPDYDLEIMVNIIERLFDAEIDYLERNPEDYFEIYEDDED